MVAESWLKSENPERFAKAMLKCQHSGAFCAQDGYCHFEGSCFKHEEEVDIQDIWNELKEIRKMLKALPQPPIKE